MDYSALSSAHLRFGSTLIRVEDSLWLIPASGFIDKPEPSRSLPAVVRPLSHSVLVPTEEVITVLTGTVRENAALGIPPEFINGSLVWEALDRVSSPPSCKSRGTGSTPWLGRTVFNYHEVNASG